MSTVNIKQSYSILSGGVWISAWLFTIGYAKLAFWQGAFALLIWPYYLGVSLSSAVPKL